MKHVKSKRSVCVVPANHNTPAPPTWVRAAYRTSPNRSCCFGTGGGTPTTGKFPQRRTQDRKIDGPVSWPGSRPREKLPSELASRPSKKEASHISHPRFGPPHFPTSIPSAMSWQITTVSLPHIAPSSSTGRPETKLARKRVSSQSPMPALDERPSDAACHPCEVVARAGSWRHFASTGRPPSAGGAPKKDNSPGELSDAAKTSGSHSSLRLPTARGRRRGSGPNGPGPRPTLLSPSPPRHATKIFARPPPSTPRCLTLGSAIVPTQRFSNPRGRPGAVNRHIPGRLPTLRPSSSLDATCLPCPSISKKWVPPIRPVPHRQDLEGPRPSKTAWVPPLEPERGRLLPWAGVSR